MTAVPIAHVLGIPVEETVALYAPVLLLVVSAAWVTMRIRLRRLRERQSAGRRIDSTKESST